MIQPGLFLQPFVVSQLVAEVIADMVEGSGISGSEFAVTSSIAIWPGVTPTELARALGMSPTTLSAMLNRLEDKGQVRRGRDPKDGRRFVLELTAEGPPRPGSGTSSASPVWLERVNSNLGGDPEGVLEPMRRLEQALRAALGR